MALWSSPKRVAVVELYGVIGRGIRAETYVPLLDGLRRSPSCGACVLALDSPGGSAAASEELYLAIRKLAASKPVVSYVRGLAASGGLYLTAATNRVVAIRTALVGSIGVIMTRLNAEHLLEKVGLSFSVQKSGAYKDMFSPWRSPTSEEVEKLQSLTDEVFQRFIEVMAEGRRLDLARVREMATGEVFTASRGKELGLVDEIGDLERAVGVAAELARVKPLSVEVRPRRPFMPWLRHGMGQELADALVGELEAMLVGRIRM